LKEFVENKADSIKAQKLVLDEKEELKKLFEKLFK
jgi:hypothetical protein